VKHKHLSVESFVLLIKLSVVQTRSTNAPLTLYCDVERFYPEDVSVSWFQNGTALPDPPATDQNPDRTYKLWGPIQTEPRGGGITCRVQHCSLKEPIERHWRNRDNEDSDKKMAGAAGALHINKVNLRMGLRDGERERLRLCVEITHPALKIPVYRTWTGETLSSVPFI
uniref:Ig-like domain-containing protein n=1 Tax=Poecilia reticulata TaxID=8081 RepID=A0A3P9QJ22_POERE